jgi:UDPglucose 6-dehydrogenase
MSDNKKISIFGAGYVGLTTAVLFANSGYKVHLVETNPERLESIQKGKSFFYELGINELLSAALESKNLVVTNNPKNALEESDIIFSCVGTPDNPDGSSNLTYVFSVADSVVEHGSDGAIFAQKSTVPVKTGEQIEKLFKKHGKKISYASNPEFLRESTAVQDSLWFDRVVVGSNDKAAAEAIIDIYKQMESCRDLLTKLSGISPATRHDGEFIVTNRNSAELIKVTSNAFLALKISFANSIAKLADKTNADINDIMDAVGADRRIGRDFLNAGRGYGGGCFPKDASGLIASAEAHGLAMPIIDAAQSVNESMPGYVSEKIMEKTDGLEELKIAILGLSFKPDTSDVRKSPGIKIANLLQSFDSKVRAYDPHANDEAKEDLHSEIKVCSSASNAVKGSEAVVVATPWKEFIDIDLDALSTSMVGKKLFIDATNSFNSNDIRKAGLDYIGIGRS